MEPAVGEAIGAMQVAGKQGSSIWILTWGSRGDHEPAAALALGLKKEGHRVKVFGRGALGSMFPAHCIDFEALDQPAMLHPANDRDRKVLRAFAVTTGFEGPRKEEDYVFDTFLLWWEHSFRRAVKNMADGKSSVAVLQATMEDLAAFHLLVVIGKGLTKLSDDRQRYIEFLARQAGKDSQDYEAGARAKRTSFREFVQGAAAKLAMSPLDLLGIFHAAFVKYYAPKFIAIGFDKPDEQRRYLEGEIAAFFAWQTEGVDLDSYWEDWLSRFPPLDSVAVLPVGGALTDCSAHGRQNLQMSCRSEGAPDLMVCVGLMLSAGLVLRKSWGSRLLLWHPDHPPRSLTEILRRYGVTCGLEGDWEGLPTPMRSMGPLGFMDFLQSTTQLISQSALVLKGASASQQYLEAFCTGKWVLDEPSAQGQLGDAGLFGTPAEQASLEDFLAAADDPPVYMGWGSMPHSNPKALAGVVVKASRLAGRRVVFVAGGSGLKRSFLEEAAGARSRILFLQSASHEFLFRRCACIVHHGGAGTCNAALRSGVPSIVSPVAVDQPANANWIESLGCGVKVEPLEHLQAEALAAALSRVLGDASLRAKAQEVAASMAEELGVPTAVGIIEKSLREPAQALPEPSDGTVCPWEDGTYDFYAGGNITPTPPTVVRGNALLDENGTLVGQMRSGIFVVKEADPAIGLSPGIYDLQAAWPVATVLLYGNLHHDGEGATWHNGTTIRLREPTDFCSVL